MICDWWISIGFVCFCVSRFVACDRNYDRRQRKTQLWRRLLNFRVRMFVKSAITLNSQKYNLLVHCKLPCYWSTGSLGSNKALPTHAPFHGDSITCIRSGHQASLQLAGETNFYMGKNLIIVVYCATYHATPFKSKLIHDTWSSQKLRIQNWVQNQDLVLNTLIYFYWFSIFYSQFHSTNTHIQRTVSFVVTKSHTLIGQYGMFPWCPY